MFDTEFYFATHTDVRDEALLQESFNASTIENINANPLQHYLEFGVEGKFANEVRFTHPVFTSENQLAFTTFIDAQSEGFEFVQNDLNQYGVRAFPGDDGEILIAQVGSEGGISVEGIFWTVFVGATYRLLENTLAGQGAIFLWELAADQISSSYGFSGETIAGNDNIFVSPGVQPGKIQIQSFPGNSSINDLLGTSGVDNIFWTPLEPVDEISNGFSFPQRDEILEGLLDGPFVFPDAEETPIGFYTIEDAFAASNTNIVFDKGTAREVRVAEITGGFKVVEPGRPKKDLVVANANNPSDRISVDVSGPNNELILVGGAKKANDIPTGALNEQLEKVNRIANSLGVSGQYYFADNTPQEAIDVAIEILGAENVFVFSDVLLEDLPRLRDLEIIRDRIDF